MGVSYNPVEPRSKVQQEAEGGMKNGGESTLEPEIGGVCIETGAKRLPCFPALRFFDLLFLIMCVCREGCVHMSMGAQATSTRVSGGRVYRGL